MCALDYRPGHPWSGLVGGAYAIVLVFLFLYGRALWAAFKASGSDADTGPNARDR
jgi:hypothetical protein